MAAGYTPSIGRFDESNEAIENYLQRLEAWLSVNDIDDAGKKRDVLISEIGPAPYATLKDLAYPAAVNAKSFDELQELLLSHYKPQTTSLTDRYKLNYRKQEPNESMTQFIAALKKLSSTCNYGDQLEERLRDALTFGVRDLKIRKSLFEASRKDGYDWKKATGIALSMEVISSELSDTTSQSSVHRLQPNSYSKGRRRGRTQGQGYRGHSRSRGGSTHGSHGSAHSSQGFSHSKPNSSHTADRNSQGSHSQAHRSQDSPRSQNRSTTDARCSRCGGYGHHPDLCYFKNEQCYKCQGYGHTQSQCSKRGATGGSDKKGRRHSVRFVSDDNVDDPELSELSESFEQLYHVSDCEQSNLPPEYKETLVVDNIPIDFTIDTACPVSVLPESLYNSRLSHLPLQPAQLKLSSYSQHVVPVLGCLQAPVQYQGENYSLPLYVTKGDDVALLGRQWLQCIRLDWRRVCSLKIQTIDDLIVEYSDVFAETPGIIKDFKAEVQVNEDTQPVFFRPRPVPYALKDKVAEQLDKLERNGVISKIDRSDWAAPIVVVPKQDKSIRICGDYKVTVNKAIKQEVYPLPTADDLFATLAGGETFTKLDLSSAYQQLELTDESRKFLVINTHQGLYEYNRLSYGVSTAPNIFQRVMDQVLQGLPGVTCYLDDILIASDRASHVAVVQKVLDRLRKFGIHVKKTKCAFMTNSVTYLGHQVSAEGLRPTAEKVQAIQELKPPTSVHELRVLLGLVNYYAKFLPDMSTLLAPWYKLLQKDFDFKWCEKCDETLTKVKKLLVSDRVLVHYDAKKPISLACDASPVGVGCVLSHIINGVERPIAYASRSLTTAERNYCQLEREGLAVIFGLVKFHKYIYGRAFTIVTDNQPISRILGPKKGIPSLAAARLQRWALILMAHNYALECRSSKKHQNCDTLSRFPVNGPPLGTELKVNFFSQVDELPITAKQIAEATRKDPVLAKAYDFTLSGWPGHCSDENLKPYFTRRDELSTDQGCLIWGTRVVIPPQFQAKLLQELHEDHPGIVRMKARARSYLWFPNIDASIENLVASCSTCQAVQKDLPPPPLIPWTFPQKPWQRIHIDFGDFKGRNLLIVVDAHSKWIDAIEVNSTTSSQTIKELRRLFAIFGLPETVVSDNGPQLVSTEFESFLRQNGIKHITSAPYHPASNGAAERTVQSVKQALKKYVLDKTLGSARNFSQALQSFLFTYRTTPHSTTGCCPSELLIGRLPRTRFALLKPNLASEVQEKQAKQKINFDKRSRAPQVFVAGEVVRVKNALPGIESYLQGVVVKQFGPYRYSVKINGRVRTVHQEHLRKTAESATPREESEQLSHPYDVNDYAPVVYPNPLPSELSRSSPRSPQTTSPVVRQSPEWPNASGSQSPSVPSTPIRPATPIRPSSKPNPISDVESRRHSSRMRIPRKRLIEEM